MDTGHSINKVQQYSQTGQSKGYMVSMVKEAVEIQDSPEGQTSVYLYWKRGGFVFHGMPLFTDQ